MFYTISLIVLISLSILIIIFMPKFSKIQLTNWVFVAIIFVCYLFLLLTMYLKLGVDDWNFQNVLPTANVSPFMFATLPIMFILPQKIKKYCLTLVALLAVGMFVSPVYTCIHFDIVHYTFYPHFLFDYIAHFTIFLLGVYLVKSKQVDLKLKDCLLSGAIMVGVGIIFMILNAILGTSFFGLSPYENHHIYNMIYIANPYLSAIVFFLGIGLVLATGYIFHRLVNLKTRDKSKNISE